jgi:hypothetical protein
MKMIDIQAVIGQFISNAQAMQSLGGFITDEQAQWKPNPDGWCLREVMDHVYNEERLDFRVHLKRMWGAVPQALDYLPAVNFHQALQDFLAEREASIAWLSALQAPDWEVKTTLQFGPDSSVTVSAAEMLLSWLEHDYLHLRQMVECLHAWNVKQTAPGSLEYAGGW